MAYRDKYLKYKKKYLELQNKLYGGTDPTEITLTEDQEKEFNEIIILLEPLIFTQSKAIFDYIFDLITCNKGRLSWDILVKCFPDWKNNIKISAFLKGVQLKITEAKETQTDPVKQIITGLYEKPTLPKNKNIYDIAYNSILRGLCSLVFKTIFNHTPDKIAKATEQNLTIFLMGKHGEKGGILRQYSLFLTKDEFTKIMTQELTEKTNYQPTKK